LEWGALGGSAGAWPAGVVALAQQSDQRAAQFPALLGVDRRVEGLFRRATLRLVGINTFEGSGNLMW